MSAQRQNLRKQCPCPETKWAKCAHSWHVVAQQQWVSLDRYCKRRGLDLVRLRGEAEPLRDRIVKEIESGTYEAKPKAVTATATAGTEPETEGLTFDQAWPLFIETLGDIESVKDEESRYRTLAAIDVPGAGRLGALSLASLTETHVETVFARATKGKAESTKKKYRRALKRLCRWAVRKKHLAVNPITEETVLRVGKDVMRTRRVKPDEEANLLEAAGEGRSDAAWRLVALITAALDICARIGELLALQWRDILWDEGEHGRVLVRAVERGARKNRKSRRVPLTPRLLVLLRRLQTLHPPGKPWAGTHYVFGDAIGGRVKKIRKAWMTCVLRAHNVLPTWSGTKIDKATREAFAAIDLHFHDLRHEGALRWLAKAYTLPTIAQLLGHSNMDSLKVYLGIEQEDALDEADRLNAAETPAAPAATAPRGSKRVVFGRRGRVLAHLAKGGARR
jgi:integrase